MNTERSGEAPSPELPNRESQVKAWWAGMFAALVAAGYLLTDRMQAADVPPNPGVTVAVRQPARSPSPEERGTLTITRPDGTKEVRYLTRPNGEATTPTSEVGDQTEVVSIPPLPETLTSFETDEGNKVNIHLKPDEAFATTGLYRLAVAIDGVDQTVLLNPRREPLAIPRRTRIKVSPDGRELTITPSEWTFEQFGYRWHQGEMPLTRCDRFDPLRDKQALTEAQQQLPVEEQAQLLFEAGTSEHRRSEASAQLLISAVNSSDWTEVTRVFGNKRSTEAAGEALHQNQGMADTLVAQFGVVHIDPTFFYLPGLATVSYPILDRDNRPTGYHAEASPSKAHLIPPSKG